MASSLPNVLLQLLSATLSTAAGKAAHQAAGGDFLPFLSAPAEVFAKQLTEHLLQQFLPAQQEAMNKIELLARDIHSLVGDIDTRVRSLQQGSGRAARLHMEDAALHPERATESLEAARRLLYESWGAATDPAQRSLAAQELSGVYAFLGRPDDSVRWLERSLPDSDLAVSQAIETFRLSMEQFTDKVPRRADPRDFITADLQHRRVVAPLERVVPAVQRLVEARYDALDLRRRSTAVGVGRPWPPAPSRVELCRSNEILFTTPGGGVAIDFDNHKGQTLGSGVQPMLRSINTLHFSIADGPWLNRPGRTYVVGSSPQLGEWEPRSAVQLAPRPKSGGTISSTVWTLARNTMEVVVQVLDDENVEFRYFFLPDKEGSIVWEQCTRRAKGYRPPSFYSESDTFTAAPKVWGVP